MIIILKSKQRLYKRYEIKNCLWFVNVWRKTLMVVTSRDINRTSSLVVWSPDVHLPLLRPSINLRRINFSILTIRTLKSRKCLWSFEPNYVSSEKCTPVTPTTIQCHLYLSQPAAEVSPRQQSEWRQGPSPSKRCNPSVKERNHAAFRPSWTIIIITSFNKFNLRLTSLRGSTSWRKYLHHEAHLATNHAL